MHASVWMRMERMLHRERMPQSLLLTGPRHAQIQAFVHRLIALMICQGTSHKPCGACKPCHLFIQGIHPDIQFIHQDTPTSPIKIEQIRELQERIYQTPQCGMLSIIVIEPADRLNHAAANALLKILEEPPEHIFFMLIAEQLRGLPATIISRCQQYRFSAPEVLVLENIDYFELEQFYANDSARGELFKQSSQIFDDLCGLVKKNISPTTLAAKWSKHALEDLLWFLYLLTAQMIRYQLLNEKPQQNMEKLAQLSNLLEPFDLFLQLDKITSLMNVVQKNIALNQSLAMESVLMGY